jgi:enoyl-CoA hydratase
MAEPKGGSLEKPVILSKEGVVWVIRINRPQVRNAINRETALALREAWVDFSRDAEARVGILTGGEEAFSAGADLKEIGGLAREVRSEHGPLGFTRMLVEKPTIGAIAGWCVAGGLELALWCDLRIAEETAVFGFFERRFGVPLIDGGTQRLPRIVGLGRALEMILTGRPVPAREALAMGLVNEVVPPGQGLDRAREWAKKIAAFPQTCLKNDRMAVYRGLGRDLQEGLSLEAALGEQVILSGETEAGASAFQGGKGKSGKFD